MLFDQIEYQLRQPMFDSQKAFLEEALVDSNLNSLSTINVSLRCQNLSQTFAIAYRCALQTLLPELNPQHWAAMCVTEVNGNHPSKIETCLEEDGRVSGSKSFVTMATLATQLIVIAKAGEVQGRSKLKAVLIKTDQDAVAVEPLPSLNMLKDLPHGKVHLSQARCKVLEGDGYEQYSKHFRTIEDVFVLLGASTFILSQAWRNNMPIGVVQQALTLVNQIQALPIVANPWCHLYLIQSFKQFDELVVIFEEHLNVCSDAFVDLWQKDKKIFSLDQKARDARAMKAIARIEAIKA